MVAVQSVNGHICFIKPFLLKMGCEISGWRFSKFWFFPRVLLCGFLLSVSKQNDNLSQNNKKCTIFIKHAIMVLICIYQLHLDTCFRWSKLRNEQHISTRRFLGWNEKQGKATLRLYVNLYWLLLFFLYR